MGNCCQTNDDNTELTATDNEPKPKLLRKFQARARKSLTHAAATGGSKTRQDRNSIENLHIWSDSRLGKVLTNRFRDPRCCRDDDNQEMRWFGYNNTSLIRAASADCRAGPASEILTDEDNNVHLYNRMSNYCWCSSLTIRREAGQIIGVLPSSTWRPSTCNE